jgi:hypothetical protein
MEQQGCCVFSMYSSLYSHGVCAAGVQQLGVRSRLFFMLGCGSRKQVAYRVHAVEDICTGLCIALCVRANSVTTCESERAACVHECVASVGITMRDLTET